MQKKPPLAVIIPAVICGLILAYLGGAAIYGLFPNPGIGAVIVSGIGTLLIFGIAWQLSLLLIGGSLLLGAFLFQQVRRLFILLSLPLRQVQEDAYVSISAIIGFYPYAPFMVIPESSPGLRLAERQYGKLVRFRQERLRGKPCNVRHLYVHREDEAAFRELLKDWRQRQSA